MLLQPADIKCPHCQSSEPLKEAVVLEPYRERMVVCQQCHQPLELTLTEGKDNAANVIVSTDNDLA